jgi:hypothetical protein
VFIINLCLEIDLARHVECLVAARIDPCSLAGGRSSYILSLEAEIEPLPVRPRKIIERQHNGIVSEIRENYRVPVRALFQKQRVFFEDSRSHDQENNGAFLGRHSSGDSKQKSRAMPKNVSTQLRKHENKLISKQLTQYYPASWHGANFESI